MDTGIYQQIDDSMGFHGILMVDDWIRFDYYNVGKARINHPFEKNFCNLFMVIWGMVYCCFNHITIGGFHKLGHAQMDGL